MSFLQNLYDEALYGLSAQEVNDLNNLGGFQPNLFPSNEQSQAQDVYNSLPGTINPLPSAGDVLLGNGTPGSNPIGKLNIPNWVWYLAAGAVLLVLSALFIEG